MGALRYVVLSDLHLGAQYSMLTHTTPDAKEIDVTVASDTLAAFGVALRQTVTDLSDDTPPTLILNGDALDLGLSKLGDVAQCFRLFIKALFPDTAPRSFAPRILYIPGNHDHHLWRVTQDELFAQQVADPQGKIPDDIIQVMDVFDPTPVRCRLLTSLIQSMSGYADMTVDIVYPSLGLMSADGRQAAVLNHGHQIDSMYRAITRFEAWITGSPPRHQSIESIERQNGPWVDFLWSNLGSAGSVRNTARTLYETMLDAGAAHALACSLADRLIDHLGSKYAIRGDMVLGHGVTVEGVLRGLIDVMAGQAADSQRDGYRELLSAAEIADLRWYIGGPLAKHMARTLGIDGRPRLNLEELQSMAFVFGHTHKPFQDQLLIEGYRAPVSIFNTGGWVMDQPTMMSRQGAAAVLIDEHINVRSLRLFNDPVNDVMPAVTVGGLGGWFDATSEFHQAIAASIAKRTPGWKSFSDAAFLAMLKRAKSDVFYGTPGAPGRAAYGVAGSFK
jgi:UDP-2,3-diacylglucosamine pyrophosphatase LpxH